jgi:MFS family permease
MFFLGVLFMQHVLGYSAIGTGVGFLPVSIGIGVMSLRFSAALNFRFGPKATLLTGLGMVTVSLAWLVRIPVHANYIIDLFPSMLLLGVGAGLCFPSLMTLAMSGATPGESGLASGLVNTTVQVGGALGLAVLATLASTRSAHLIATGVGHASALTSGYHLAWLISASVAFAGFLIAVPLIRSVRLGEGHVPAVETEPTINFNADPSFAEAA